MRQVELSVKEEPEEGRLSRSDALVVLEGVFHPRVGLWLPHEVRSYACALELLDVVLEADEEDGLLLGGPLYVAKLPPQFLRPPVRDVGPVAGPGFDPPRIPQLQQSDDLTVLVLDFVDREELKGLTRDKAALARDLPLLAR